MKKRQEARLDALRRMRRFVARNGGALGGASRSRARAVLDELLGEIRRHVGLRRSAEESARKWTERRRQLRGEVVRNHLPPIAAIVRARLADEPTLVGMRRLNADLNDRELVALGAAMTDALAPFSQVFAEEQLPASFLTDFRAAIDVLDRALNEGMRCQLERSIATADLVNDFRRAKQITPVLDALVVRQLRSKPKLLADWLAARRINWVSKRALEPRVDPSRRQYARAGSTTSRVSNTPYKEAV